MKLLEIHALQNFVPSLLNRDDTGSHKDCVFGGKRRARISSQCWKRAVREHFKNSLILDSESLALRSKLFHQELEGLLSTSVGESSSYVAEAVLAVLGLFHEESSEDEYATRKLKSEYLVFLGRDNLSQLAALVEGARDPWLKAGQDVRAIRDKDRTRAKPAYKGNLDKKDDLQAKVEKTLGKDMVQKTRAVLTASRALDLALFGRMLADKPELNVDAACQVAHAISTHEVTRDYDYFTAVDDLQPDDNAGAGMIGNTEFSSACYYRYSQLNLQILRENLGDQKLAIEGAKAFVQAFVEARPSAKQNAYAAHNWPSYVLLRLADAGQPFNLANAFENAIRGTTSGWLDGSVAALEKEWEWLQQAYGLSGQSWGWSRNESRLATGSGLSFALDGLGKALSSVLVA